MEEGRERHCEHGVRFREGGGTGLPPRLLFCSELKLKKVCGRRGWGGLGSRPPDPPPRL